MDFGTEQRPHHAVDPDTENELSRSELADHAHRQPLDPPDEIVIYRRQEPSSIWAVWLACGLAFVVSVAVLLSSVNRPPSRDLAGKAAPVINQNGAIVEGAIVTTSDAKE